VRRRLSLLVAATTSAIVLAFVIPMVLLVGQLAEDRALNAARNDAVKFAGAIQTTDPETLASQMASMQVVSSRPLSLVLPDENAPDQPREIIGQGFALTTDERRSLASAFGGTATTRPVGNTLVVYQPLVVGSTFLVLRTVVPASELREGLPLAIGAVTGLGVLLLAAAVLAADRMAARVSAPIRGLARAADALRDGRLDTRAPEEGLPEVVTLARALNRLAARIEQLLASERDAVADLSHRLRTPVTALRLDTDSVHDPEVAERLRLHVATLERTVDAIVHDARRPVSVALTASCNVGRVVRERVGFWSALADEQGRPLRLAVPDRPVLARISAADLVDSVDVLIDNVFAHTDEGVPVEVWVTPRADGAAVLTVEDGGPGLPEGDVVARGSSGAGSTGLGLDIARRAALASGGSLELGRSRLGGAMIRMVLGPVEA
jgi:signal transduction histidine kinase